MNNKEFEKLIIFEELAKTTDIQKFMLKVYLDCLLKGGKRREDCYMYSIGEISNKSGTEFLKEMMPLKFMPIPLNFDIAVRKKLLIELFEQMKKQGFWVVEENECHEFDENEKEIYPDDEDYEQKKISKVTEITTKTTYYLDKSLDIKPHKFYSKLKKLK